MNAGNRNILNLKVGGMSCMGCVASIRGVLTVLPGVAAVDVDLTDGRVTVEHDPAHVDAAAIRAAIEAGGYQVLSA